MTGQRVAALALGAFTLSFVGGGVLLGEVSGALGDGDHVFIEHYASGSRRAGDIAGSALLILAGASFLVFVPAMSRVLDHRGVAAGVFSQAGAAFAVLLVVAAGLLMATPTSMSFGGLFDDTGQFGGGHAAVLPQAGTVILLTAVYPIGALAVGAMSIASRTAEVMPRWHFWLSLVCAAVMPLAFFYFPILTLPVWSAATTVVLWRSQGR